MCHAAHPRTKADGRELVIVLWGPGGAGKSCLAEQIVHELLLLRWRGSAVMTDLRGHACDSAVEVCLGPQRPVP